MTRIKTTIIAFVLGATMLAALPAEVNADGPLRRWLRGLRTPKSNCSTCATPVSAFARYTPNAYNLKPGQCMKTCQQTCSRTVVNYVPYTAYRTTWKQVPVTQYKPVTTSDPCTGCTVTCMKPCTTYTYQCQRVPYTTYRPVYRQETYKVPVTTITNDCSTRTCAPCNTGCAPCGTAAPGNFAPQLVPTPAPINNTYYERVPSSALSTGSGLNTTVPANNAPSLLNGVSSPQASQRPILDRFGSQNGGQGTTNVRTSSPIQVREEQSNAPAMINIEDKTAQSPVRKQWNYSPIRMASYTKPTAMRSIAPRQTVQPKAIWSKTRPAANDLNGWVEVN